jgi:hypothetical protein
MTAHMSHEEFLEKKKAEVISVASEMLDRRIGIIEGSRRLTQLRGYVTEDMDDDDFMIFVVIESETDDLPVGEERQYWATWVLPEYDKKILHAEEFYREHALEGCRKLLERFRAV